MKQHVLMMYYEKYLKEIKNLSTSSIKHYKDAINTISRLLVKKGKIKETIYEIHDINELEIIKEFLFNDVDFIALNSRGHHMYSVGFNHYYTFANGSEFLNAYEKMDVLDVAVPVAVRETNTYETWRRSSIIKIQALESAKYECEVNKEHETFTSKSTGKQYMEGHHAVPMKYQEQFDNSLDIYANIICLCPVCHRLLHYGVDSEKTTVVRKIYNDRSDRLANCGIRLSQEEFYEIVI